MTHEQNPEQLLDTVEQQDAAFADAIDRLRNLQIAMDACADGDTMQELIDHYSDAATTIHSYCEDKVIMVTGSGILVPSLDEDGDLDGMLITSDMVSGKFGAIKINPTMFDGYNSRQVVGMSLEVGKLYRQSPVHKQVTQLYAFVPFESCQFSVDRDEAELLPEDNDEIAEFIDEAILNGPIDLLKLSVLFQENEWSELATKMYLAHLNRIASFQFVEALAPYGIIMNDSDNVQIYQDKNTYVLSGRFKRFNVANFKTENEVAKKLIIVAEDDDKDLMGVIVEDIEDIKLT